MSATERMAEFIVHTRLEDIPDPVVASAKRAILDTVGVAVAGASEPVGRKITQYVQEMGAAPEATVLGTGVRTSAPWAALANGTLGHALDFDDSNWLLNGHASVGVLPAVLAQAEARGASGREALEAYIIGFEVSAKLGAAMNMALYDNGWHPTAAIGPMGAAAAASRLRGLGVEGTRTALGCAASHASGIRTNFGTMMKPIHAGLAAEAGVRSAAFAAAGITANLNVLEAKRGFGDTFSGQGKHRIPEIVETLGRPFALEKPGNNIKPYPCCMSSHAAVDALRDLLNGANLTASDIERIELELTEPNYLNLSYHQPRTGLEGKFSGEYILSRLVADRELRLSTFTDAAVNDPGIQALMKKVQVRLSDLPWTPGSGRPAVVTVRTRDGRTLQNRRQGSRGNAGSPLTNEELQDKFRDCAGGHLGPEKTAEAIRKLTGLERLPDIRALISLLH